MTSPDHTPEYIHRTHDASDQWTLTCLECFKPVTATRPPIFNPENCSCVEDRSFTNGEPSYTPRTLPDYETTIHDQDSSLALQYRPESYASSAASVRCPEGPESAQPNMSLMNTSGYGAYAQAAPSVAPAPSSNALQHHHLSSVDADRSYTLRRFLGAGHGPFLTHEVHVRSQGGSMRATKGSKGSKFSGGSRGSVGSIGSAEMHKSVGKIETIREMGAWAKEDGASGQYAMAMSGLSDAWAE
ncbi:hypothetical protein B7494_g3124 [Chlorociboria aeruginascens]|nr:hypothetical protein B7494_g3124 [Chlorociboria aeruginascens]